MPPPPPPRNKALIWPNQGTMVVNSPLIRPYFLGEVAFGVPLRFPRRIPPEVWCLFWGSSHDIFSVSAFGCLRVKTPLKSFEIKQIEWMIWTVNIHIGLKKQETST